jgi:hypothetical protein
MAGTEMLVSTVQRTSLQAGDIVTFNDQTMRLWVSRALDNKDTEGVELFCMDTNRLIEEEAVFARFMVCIGGMTNLHSNKLIGEKEDHVFVYKMIDWGADMVRRDEMAGTEMLIQAAQRTALQSRDRIVFDDETMKLEVFRRLNNKVPVSDKLFRMDTRGFIETKDEFTILLEFIAGMTNLCSADVSKLSSSDEHSFGCTMTDRETDVVGREPVG